MVVPAPKQHAVTGSEESTAHTLDWDLGRSCLTRYISRIVYNMKTISNPEVQLILRDTVQLLSSTHGSDWRP